MSGLPAGWASMALGDLVMPVTGSVKPEPDIAYELYSVPAFPEDQPEIVTGASIGSAKRPVVTDDVLLCKINPRINRVWIVGKESGRRQLASTEFIPLRLPPGQVIMARYLMWYLRSPRFRAWIELNAEGATGSHTRAKSSRILRQMIPVAPLVEQGRIVAAIEEHCSCLDAGLAALKRVEHNLKRMRAGILLAAVNGKLIEGNSDGWELVSLGQLLLDIEAGKSFRCDERHAGLDEWGVIKVSAMTWGEFRPEENKTVMAGREIDDRLEIRPGDLLVSRANTVDYVGAVVQVRDCRPRLLLSDKSLRLIPGPRVLPEWLVIVLRSQVGRRYIEHVATGTSDSMRNISQSKLRAMPIPVPTIQAQKRIVDEVGRQISLIARASGEVSRLKEAAKHLRASILDAAFLGELVHKDRNDQPASVLLERIVAERASSNGSKPIKARSSHGHKIPA